MTTLALGQTIAGTFSSSTPILNGRYYNEYDLPSSLTNLSQIQVEFNPNTGSNTAGVTYVDLINATTGTILSSETAQGFTSSSALGLVDQTIYPGIKYKVRVSNSDLSSGNYSLSLINKGQATSIVSRGFIGTNGSNGYQIGTLNATGGYSSLGWMDRDIADVALSPSGLLYGITDTSFASDKLLTIDPSRGIGNAANSTASDLKDPTGNIFKRNIQSLAFSSSNQLYAIGTLAGVGSFYQIDINTNVATLLATLPTGFNNSGDLVYDAANNRFLATSADTGATNALWQIPLSNPAGATKVGQIGFLNVRGLSFEGNQLVGFANPQAGSGRSGADKITINSAGVGTFSLSLPNYGDINGAATLVPLTKPTRNDFNGDGKSDILWRDTNGSVAVWQMDGATVSSSGFTSTSNVDPSWSAAGTGDFSGDGKSDILWRNTNGSVSIWKMDGSTVSSSGFTSISNVEASWTVAGTGDFGGDGKSDILWRNTNGSVSIWKMDGANVVSSGFTSISSADISWKVAGTADFTGDGKADILWRKTDGSIALWQMDGANVVSSGLTSISSADVSWKVAGTGDFTGDGKADILWRNDSGAVALWKMDGSTVVSSGLTSISSVDNSWKVSGTADFNGDSKADILWRNDSGAASVWTMDGANVLAAGFTSIPTISTSWQVAAPIL